MMLCVVVLELSKSNPSELCNAPRQWRAVSMQSVFLTVHPKIKVLTVGVGKYYVPFCNVLPRTTVCLFH
jgi:hypothetical protein